MRVKKVSVELRNGHQVLVELPAKKVVCCRCDGTGSHDHGSFNGLTSDDLADQDFSEAYLNGQYDVTCEECKGERVVLEVDRDALSEKMLKRLERAENTAYRDFQDAEGERRWGA